ncbi:MAG: TIGR03013 family PEP-CTERM/XrtA system glycosyltransferase [Methylococcaceae bacterium]|nr:TIGR03013 family PEP-CTERM/XrtA system glycosyltransferase [Methylococcaceae bacterium]
MIRVFNHYISSAHLYLQVMEWMILVLVFYYGSYFFIQADPFVAFNETLLTAACAIAILFSLSFSSVGMYRRMTFTKKHRFHIRLLFGYLLPLFLLYACNCLWPQNVVLQSISIGGLAFVYFVIWAVHAQFYRIGDMEKFKRRILVIGCDNLAKQLHSTNASYVDSSVAVVGYAHFGNKTSTFKNTITLTNNGDLTKACKDLRVQEIVLAMDDKRSALPLDELVELKLSGISIIDLLTYYEREERLIYLDLLSPSWFMFSDGFRVSWFRWASKRLFDIVASVTILVATWWIMLLAILAILIESGWDAPVLYRQVRVGQNNRLFNMIKFRSMRVDAEKNGAQWAMENDDRTTVVGRFIRKYRIDELPQLFVVLKGDMSFVGPRPERPEFVEGFVQTVPYYKERHRVKPGITGWAQLCYAYGANEFDTRRKLEYDLYYTKNYSLFLDMSILLNTIEVILFGEGVR